MNCKHAQWIAIGSHERAGMQPKTLVYGPGLNVADELRWCTGCGAMQSVRDGVAEPWRTPQILLPRDHRAWLDVDGAAFEHLGFHSPEHWVNIVPHADGWVIVGFLREPRGQKLAWGGLAWTDQITLVLTWEQACAQVGRAIKSKPAEMR